MCAERENMSSGSPEHGLSPQQITELSRLTEGGFLFLISLLEGEKTDLEGFKQTVARLLAPAQQESEQKEPKLVFGA